MQKRFFGVLLTVALVGGLLSAAATPAFANHNDGPPPASLLPDDDGVGAVIGTVLSDRNDGTDGAAHLTALAPPFVERVQWRKCPTTVTAPIDNADITACNVILGDDAEGDPLGTGTAFPPTSADEAYELFLNITAQMETDSPADVITLGCNANPGETLANCVAVLDEGIVFNDAESGLPGTQASSAEMFAICTADTAATGGPGAGVDDVCQVGGANAGTPAEVADRFNDWGHGDPVPNDGFVLRVSTSPDLNTANDLSAFRDWTGIGGGDGGTGESDNGDQNNLPCTVLDSNASRAIWECVFPDAGAGDDDANQEIGVYDFPDAVGQGECAGAVVCLLDAHGAESQERVAATAVMTFTGSGSTPGANCADPVTEDRNELGDTQAVDLCLTDQFGDAFNGDATIELDTSVVTTTGFTLCDGTTEDHDGDGYDEHCEGVTGADGVLRGEITNPQDLAPPADRGDQVITGCSEGEADPADANHGCADETVTASITKTWFSLPAVVHLVFADTGDPADPCLTGDSFRENKVGQKDTLLACTFDKFGNPTTTDQEGGGRLQWTIDTTQGGDKTGVEFTSPPPSETDATTAQATAEIVATRRSGNFICVDLENVRGSGATADDDCVEKVVSPGGGGGRADSKVTIKGRFKGRVKSPSSACKNGRKVILKKVKPGKDKTVGTDNAGTFGRWRISRPNAVGRFYAKVNKNAQCKAARSRTVRRF
jgi:hypothetical protein